MATSDSKRSRAAREDQAKVEQAAHLAGIAGALSEAVALGPQVLALQKAVLEGLARSQKREAERLKARHGENDPRIGLASNRALRFDELRTQAVAQAEVADRLAQTFRVDGIFHGYVHHADATPAAAHTVRLVLQPGLIDDDLRRRIWTRGTQRNAYHLGFLEAVPDDLPAPVPAHADYEAIRAVLTLLADNPIAALLVKLLDSPGQTFLAVSETQLRHPLDKYTTARLFDTIGNYFAPARRGTIRDIARFELVG